MINKVTAVKSLVAIIITMICLLSHAQVPVITSFTPQSGVAGTTISIAGNNFGAAPNANAVFFGAVKAQVISASATQLIVTVPSYATYSPIMVENLASNLSASSTDYFTPLFNNNKDFGGRIIPAAFAERTDMKIGSVNAEGITFADLDGDGFADMIVAGGGNDSLLIYRSKGNNLLGEAGYERTGLYYDTDTNHTPLANDIDGDGKLDLVMLVRGLYDTDAILIYHNESTPGSLTPASFGTVFTVSLGYLHINNAEMNIADMDADGKPELIANNSGVISVFKNNSVPGSFNFASSVDIAGTGGGAISIADIDGDGKPDIGASGGYYGTAGFSLAHNTSTTTTISFDAPVQFVAADGTITDVEIADVDADHKPDVVWEGPYSAGNGLHVMKNTATAGAINASSLAAQVDYFVSAGTTSASSHTKLADVNGDGKPDVISCQYLLTVFENACTTGVIDASSFHQGVLYNNQSTNYSVQNPAVEDVDGDGKPEIVATVSSYSGNILSIFKNQTYPAPRIDLLKNTTTPVQSGLVGSAIMTGGDFQFTHNDIPVVHFGGMISPPNTTSNTSITLTIPAGAGNDRISVTSHGLTGFSPVVFHPTFSTNSTLDGTTFATSIDFPLTSGATPALVVADFDNDGKPDILAGDGGNILPMQNLLPAAGGDITSATFNPEPIVSASIGLDPITLSDIDGDGTIDFIGYANLFRNNSGTQAQPVSFEPYVQGLQGSYANAGRLKANDLNHDGKTDVISVSGSTLFVNENHSTKGAFVTGTFSTFAQAVSFTITGTLAEVSASDFDGDGFDDIIFIISTTAQLGYMLNAGHNSEITTSSFGPVQYASTGSSPAYIFVDDFNSDGKADVAVGYSSTAAVSIYTNSSSIGAISFTKHDFTSLPNSVGLTAADLDGDGKPEVITIHGNNSDAFNFSILKNTSQGSVSFAGKVDFSLTSQPSGLATGDVNLDGKTDIVISRGAVVSVFQNRLTSSEIILVGLQPVGATVCAGTTRDLSVSASGTTDIAYQWQSSASASGTFTDLTDGNGITGSSTATLVIVTGSSIGSGFYRARINGDGAAQAVSNIAQIVVNAVPANPATNGASVCAGGSVTLTASGASDGNYRWYSQATGSSPIANAVDATFVITDVSASTVYYVSIVNGGCESDRIMATATVLSTNCSGSPPVIRTETLSTVPGGTIVVDLKQLITTSGTLDISSIRLIVTPKSNAKASISNGILTIDYSGIAFTGSESITVEACDDTGMCSQQTFNIDVYEGVTVYNGVSPNGDDLNDYFKILNIEQLPATKNNNVTIYNRWGDVVFSVADYDNDVRAFKGYSNSGNKLPSGTYFYRIDMPDAKKTLRGYLSLKY